MEKKSERYITEVYDNTSDYFMDIVTCMGYEIPLNDSERYDLVRESKPTIGEAKYAFYNWNCAILTAFRGVTPENEELWKSQGLSDNEIKDKNFNLNLEHNEDLKEELRNQELLFRTVDGYYKEYGTNKYVKELSMFVTNCDKDGNVLDEKTFFEKVYRLAENYEQDCFLFTFRGGNRVAFLIATNDNGRKDFRNDMHFAGPLYTTKIGELDSWTQFEDGKLSFMLKGMILRSGDDNKKVLIGEGDLFDVENYNADGLVVICQNGQKDLKKSCNKYDGKVSLVKRYFLKKNQTEEDVKEKIFTSLNALLREKKLARRKKITIGFHCSACIDGSYLEGAEVVLSAVKLWAARYDNRLKSIILVDIYGEYGKILNGK